MTSRKRVGERTDPCRTPRLTEKEGEVWQPTLIVEVILQYQSLMRRQAFPETPALRRLRRVGYSTELNADERS